MPDSPTPRFLVSSGQVRGALALGGVGAVALILGILLLTTARPQGSYVTVDDSQHQQRLQAAEAALGGFALNDGGGAQLAIDHAMQLVVARGVNLPIHAGGGAPAAAAAAAGAVMAQAAVDGAAVYAQHCMACHLATGAGIPSAFPPIAGHVGDLVAADRAYPAKLVLFGMMGPITVNGTAYNGLMPGLGAQLSDAEVAAVLEHVLTAWDDVAAVGDAHVPYGADEVAEWRALGLGMTDVHALRLSLELP